MAGCPWYPWPGAGVAMGELAEVGPLPSEAPLAGLGGIETLQPSLW